MPASHTPSLYGVSPGMTLDEVRARLGTEDETRTHEEAEQWWKSAGYEPDKELPFVLGFDQQLTFNQDHPDYAKPVWYVYFDKGRAVLFKVAIYEQTSDPALTTRFGFPPTCFIRANASEIVASLGAADVSNEHDNRKFHYYLRRGLAVTEEAGHIIVLDVFPPVDGARTERVRAALQ